MSIDNKSIDDFVKVLHLARNHSGNEYVGNFHSHDYFEIIYIHSAHGISHMIDFEDFICHAGDMFLLHPNQIHKFNAQPDATHKMTVLQIQSNYFLEVVAAPDIYSDLTKVVFYFRNRVKLDKSRSTTNLGLIGQIDLEMESGKKYHASMISNFLRTLLIEVSRDVESAFESSKNSVLKKFWRLLDEMYQQSITIEKIAEKLNISSRQLHRIVTENTRKSPKKHKDERLSLQAKRMLYRSDKAVKQIAYELGFDDISNFTKFFIRQNTVSPTEFRKSMSEKYH